MLGHRDLSFVLLWGLTHGKKKVEVHIYKFLERYATAYQCPHNVKMYKLWFKSYEYFTN